MKIIIQLLWCRKHLLEISKVSNKILKPLAVNSGWQFQIFNNEFHQKISIWTTKEKLLLLPELRKLIKSNQDLSNSNVHIREGKLKDCSIWEKIDAFAFCFLVENVWQKWNHYNAPLPFQVMWIVSLRWLAQSSNENTIKPV